MSRFSATILGLLVVAGLTGLTVWEAAPRLETDLASRVERELESSSLRGVHVVTEGRDVVLTGPATAREQYLASEVLSSVPGVRAFRNDLEVSGRGAEATDAPSGSDSLSTSDASAADSSSASRIGAPARDPDWASRGQDQLEVSGSDDADVLAAAAELRDVLSTGAITFASGTAELAPGSRGLLDAVADVLTRYPAILVQVQGHTDSEGTSRSNRRLSQHRADAVAAYLIEAGVPDPALRARGYGEAAPITSDETFEGRARNRRVVFVLGTR